MEGNMHHAQMELMVVQHRQRRKMHQWRMARHREFAAWVTGGEEELPTATGRRGWSELLDRSEVWFPLRVLGRRSGGSDIIAGAFESDASEGGSAGDYGCCRRRRKQRRGGCGQA
ncbi:hypothetical protein L2E82_14410 [Cichorium intybus]|uniref:Uncharacterized protein n=1 Tax=Cichorium intybus TaxID=13427 RepID=A0ACB9F0R2_CICIN|nr:hypothetical protein L2E82_14410 [Cichorium intybus]